MADNESLAKKFAKILATPTSSKTEVEEARAELEILASRGSIYARECLNQFPAVQIPQTERPAPPETDEAVAAYLAQGASPALAKILAECDALSEANKVENIRLAPVRAERRAELEAAMTRASVAESWKHGYRRQLEVYQEHHSFAEETKVFESLMSELGRQEQCKQTLKG